MKKGFISAMALTAMLLGGQAQAQQIQLTSNYDDSAAVTPEVTPVNHTATCGDCNGEGCGTCCGDQCEGCDSCCGGGGLRGCLSNFRSCLPPCADPCPRIGLYYLSGYDTFNGRLTNIYPSNTGGSGGLNVAAPVGQFLGDRGIGFQAGGTYGLYNWSGNAGSPTQQVGQQYFFTYGFFRRADACRPISWGIVQDWMLANNISGILTNTPGAVRGDQFTIAQFRGQIAYAFSDKNEVGLLGQLHSMSATSSITSATYQSINQVSAFYHRKFNRGGADGWFSIGMTENTRLSPATPTTIGANTWTYGGSLGAVVLGTNWLVPLNDRLSIYANWNYLFPSQSSNSPQGQTDTISNLQFGIAYYPGRAARSSTVAGRKFMPYMPVATNGTFMTDTNLKP